MRVSNRIMAPSDLRGEEGEEQEGERERDRHGQLATLGVLRVPARRRGAAVAAQSHHSRGNYQGVPRNGGRE